MTNFQVALAVIALTVLVLTLGSTLVAIWDQAATVDNLLKLTDLVLSWKLVAAGLVFGGGQALIRAARGQG